MAKESFEEIERDFEVFSKGIERLEELKKELKGLDTKGFEDDVKIIRPKLKSVSAIPEIERKITNLKIKISGKDKKPKSENKKKLAVSKLEKQMAELKDVIDKKPKKEILTKKDLKCIHQMPQIIKATVKIRSIVQQLEKGRKKPLLKPEIDVLNKVPLIEKQILDIKDSILNLQQKKKELTKTEEKGIDIIPGVEEDINKLKELANNRYKETSIKLRDMPKLKGELEYVKEKIKAREILMQDIDKEVSSLTEREFKDFLTDMKYVLSERVKKKERLFEERFNHNIKKIREDYKAKQSELVALFAKKFEDKVKADLKKEVSERFDEKLKAKLDYEEAILSRKANKELEDEKSELRKNISEELKTKKQDLSNKLNDMYKCREDAMENMIKDKVAALNEKENMLINDFKEQSMANEGEIEGKRAALEEEKNKLINELKEQSMANEREIEGKRAALKEKEDNLTERISSKIKTELENENSIELEKKKSELEMLYKEKVKAKVAAIRGELESKFSRELKNEIEERESKMNQDMVDMEEEVKKAFGDKLAQQLEEKEKAMKRELNRKARKLMEL